MLVAKKRRARLVPPGVRRPDRCTPCEVAEWALWDDSSQGDYRIGDSCIVFVSMLYSTEDRSLRLPHLWSARWRSSLLKNGMVTLWAAIYLRISLRRGDGCGPPGLCYRF